MSTIYDPIRKKHVVLTPEEKIRQRLIRQMVGPLGYPRGLIAVEKEISSLCPIPADLDADRRVDILCYRLAKEGLAPLLLVECKVHGQDRAAAFKQACGYNERIGVPFIALADEEGVEMFWREQKGFMSVLFLPRFQQLVDQLCRL